MTSYRIKIIALICMTADHFYVFVPNTPSYLHWIGRLAAPLFIFILTWSIDYTKNIFIFVLRLYFFNVLIGMLFFTLNTICFKGNNTLYMNMFGTLFCIALLITIAVKVSEIKRRILYMILALTIPCVAAAITSLYSETCFIIGNIFFPNVMYCDGGVLWILIGILIYYTKEEKKRLTWVFILISIVVFVIDLLICIPNLGGILKDHCQWMMLFALPVILAYNNEEGKKNKYLFYLYYPVHIVALAAVGSFL